MIVLDESCASTLQRCAKHGPVWIAETPVTRPVIEAHWAEHPAQNHHLDGVTSFRYSGTESVEDTFFDLLDTVDLHHGPYSTSDPYTRIQAVGVPLSSALEASMPELGFISFEATSEGFIARLDEHHWDSFPP